MPKKTLEAVIESGNSIVMQVKGNQESLLEEVIRLERDSEKIEIYSEYGKEHGRIEKRVTKTFSLILNSWPEITTGCSIKRITINKKKNQFIERESISYYISDKCFSAKEMHKVVRNHWAIENSNHHIRDTVLMEDNNRIRIKPANMMILRSFGYNVIQANMNGKNFTSQMETNKMQFKKVLKFRGISHAN